MQVIRMKEEEKLMLAESVLRHLRNGKTEEYAFQEISQRFNYPVEDLKFYWSYNLSKTFKSAIDLATKQGIMTMGINPTTYRIQEEKSVRSDGWTKQQDELLAETVLKYIRDGNTQIKAFQEVGDKLNRTDSAVAFRWNSEVRKQYEEEIERVKQLRNQPAMKDVSKEEVNQVIKEEKKRSDSWTKEQDTLLAETVLKHVRNGGVQGDAFQTIGDELNRTTAAVGYRWNAVLREQYQTEFKEARKIRLQNKRNQLVTQRSTVQTPKEEPIITASTTVEKKQIPSPQRKETEGMDVNQMASLLKVLMDKADQYDELLGKYKLLEKEYSKINTEHQELKEDYQAFAQIFNRARQVMFTEDNSKTKYRVQ